MVSSVVWITLAGILLVCVEIIIALYFYYKEEEYKSEKNHVINLANLQDGRAYGHSLYVEKIAGDRHKIMLYPTDFDFHDKESLREIKPVEIIVDSGKMLSFPKGTWSKYKNILFLLPTHANHLPKEFLQTSFGKTLALYMETVNAEYSVQQALLEGIARQKEHIKNLGNGEATVERLRQIEGLLKDAIKIGNPEPKKSSLLSNTGLSGSQNV